MSKRQDQILNKLQRVSLHIPNSYVRTSHNGVPHIVVPTDAFDISLTYFAKRRKWKAFWPYPSNYGPQRSESFQTEKEVIAYALGTEELSYC